MARWILGWALRITLALLVTGCAGSPHPGDTALYAPTFRQPGEDSRLISYQQYADALEERYAYYRWKGYDHEEAKKLAKQDVK